MEMYANKPALLHLALLLLLKGVGVIEMASQEQHQRLLQVWPHSGAAGCQANQVTNKVALFDIQSCILSDALVIKSEIGE